MRPIGCGLLCAFLVLAAGCGGSPKAKSIATNLVYTNPTDTASWRLVADPASSATHLVLDLMAPDGASGQGLTLVLTTSTAAATWSSAAGAYASSAIYGNPVVNVASVKGADLRMVIAQAPGTPVTYGTTRVLAVALDLAANVPLGTISLSASQGGHLGITAQPAPITVAVGALQAE